MIEAAARPPIELTLAARPPTSQTRLAWRSFVRNRLALGGAAVVIALYLLAAFAPTIAPQDYRAFNSGQPLKAPSAAHWFGTDRQTRDVFSRVLVAAQVSLSIGL